MARPTVTERATAKPATNRSRARIFVAVCGAAALLAIAGCRLGTHISGMSPGQVLTRQGGGPIHAYGSDDAEMNAAVKNAQDTLDGFIAEMAQPKPDTVYMVKVRFDVGANGGEHIWIDHLQYHDGKFTGRLTDEPDSVPQYHNGDAVTADRDHISDWAAADKNGMRGAFTQAVIDRKAGAASN